MEHTVSGSSSSSASPSSSSSISFAARFDDLPLRFQQLFNDACTDAMRQFIDRRLQKIKSMNLDEKPSQFRLLKEVYDEVEAAEHMGINVKEHKQHLDELCEVANLCKHYSYEVAELMGERMQLEQRLGAVMEKLRTSQKIAVQFQKEFKKLVVMPLQKLGKGEDEKEIEEEEEENIEAFL